MSHEAPERGYVRAVEAAWSKVVGRPMVVSPREFAAIDGWRRRGIPLTVVLEALAAAGKRRSRPPKSLTALTHAVDETFAVVAAGRTTNTRAPEVPTRSDARGAWENALARCADGDALRELLTRLLVDEAEGVSASAIDAALDEGLPAAVSKEQLDEARSETLRALGPFRGRMSDDEFQGTLSRALTERLRLRLVLPRLSLTR